MALPSSYEAQRYVENTDPLTILDDKAKQHAAKCNELHRKHQAAIEAVGRAKRELDLSLEAKRECESFIAMVKAQTPEEVPEP